jgi:hypothetical protein
MTLSHTVQRNPKLVSHARKCTVAHLKPSSGEQARHLLPQAGEGQKARATRLKNRSSLLPMLGEAPKPEGAALRARRVGDEGSAIGDFHVYLHLEFEMLA